MGNKTRAVGPQCIYQFIILQQQQQQQQQQSQLQSQLSQHSHLQSSQQQTPYNSALQQQQTNSALQQQQANSALQQSASGLQGNQGLSSLSSQNANILQQVAAAAALSQLPAANQNQLRPYFSAYNNPVASALGSMFYPGSIFGGQSLNPFFSAAAGASQVRFNSKGNNHLNIYLHKIGHKNG